MQEERGGNCSSRARGRLHTRGLLMAGKSSDPPSENSSALRYIYIQCTVHVPSTRLEEGMDA